MERLTDRMAHVGDGKDWLTAYKAQALKGHRPAVIILAAECHNDMQSDLPLALHPVGERPLINHSIDAALSCSPSQIIVTTSMSNTDAIHQAVQRAFPTASCPISITGVNDKADSDVLIRKQRQKAREVLAHDVAEIIELPCQWYVGQNVAEALMGHGRKLLQRGGACCSLVEPSLTTRGLARRGKPRMTDLLWASAAYWREVLPGEQGLDPSKDHHICFPDDLGLQSGDVSFISDRSDLAAADTSLRASEIRRHQAAGVTFRDPAGTFLSSGVQIGRESAVGVGIQIYGKTTIGRCVRIEGPTVIKDCTIGDNVRIGAFTHLEQVSLASDSGVGPFARLRAGASIDSGAYIGNFCELKSAHVGQGSNVCHLSYLGDADVGAQANIGAGTITCNYNGVAKNRTSIAAGAFIGSNSTLVAPVTVGEKALIAAGSVITTDVPADALAFGRSRQTINEHRADATRDKLRAEHERKAS